MGKQSHIAALRSHMLDSETVLWSGVVMQAFDSAAGGLKFKTRALLTQSAIVWSSIRDAEHPIRIEYDQMTNPRLAMKGITGTFLFTLSNDTVAVYTKVSSEIQWIDIEFVGVTSAFMDVLVPLVPRLELDGRLLQERYKSRPPRR